MKIGFFDSGFGGLTVLNEALNKIPNHEYLYYADTVHAPYGTKTKDEVRQYVFDAVEFLINQGAEIIVIACNTATSIAASQLREKYKIPFIGMEPAVKPALEISGKNNKRVLVTATALTLKEEKMKTLLKQYDQDKMADLCPLPGLVKLAESLTFSNKEVIPYLKEAFSPFNLDDYGSVVLGCTHFPLFKEQINSFFSSETILVDGSLGTVKHLVDIINSNPNYGGNRRVTFYSSGKMMESENEKAPFNKILSHLNNI